MPRSLTPGVSRYPFDYNRAVLSKKVDERGFSFVGFVLSRSELNAGDYRALTHSVRHQFPHFENQCVWNMRPSADRLAESPELRRLNHMNKGNGRFSQEVLDRG